MKKAILTTIAAFGLCLGASAATIIAQWDFNDNPSDGIGTTGTFLPAIGSGLAGPVGTPITSGFLLDNGSSDPLGTDPNNSNWRLANFPAQNTANKSKGAQYAVDTTGYQNITMTWDQLDSNPASKYWRIQYSTDNGATWVDKDVIVNTAAASDWISPIATVSFLAVPGANNNPNFIVRLLSEWQSTATGSGIAGYVALNGTSASYTTAGTLKMDMVIFSGTTYSDSVNITTDPTNQVVGLGQPVSFSVAAAGGSTPYTYQWRKNTLPLADATNSLYAIAAAQHPDAGSYDVIVTNGFNSRTSAVATLTISDPQGLAWTGLNGSTWDTTNVNWVNTNSLANVAYTNGDHVLFDSRGASAPSINLAESLNPSSVTVDANTDYLLRSDVGGQIAGTTGLTKRGTGTLTLDTDNTYTGPTVIQAGVLQVGAMDAHGSTGTGPITNNGALVFNLTNSVTLINTITGSGSLTNIGGDVTLPDLSGTVTLEGANTYNGPIAVKKGSLVLSGNQTVNSTQIVVSPSASVGPGGATKFGIAGGMVIGSGTTVYLPMLITATDSRCTLVSPFGTNSFNGPVVAEGSGPIAFAPDGVGTLLNVNGNVSGPSYAGVAFLRGSGAGILNGTINLPTSLVHKTDDGTWTINSTGNSWFFTTFASGTLRLGADNALPTGLTLEMGVSGKTATLDLGGHVQQLAILRDSLTFGPQIIGSRSVTSDSTLTVGSGFFSGTIQDKIGSTGTRKTSLTLNGTAFTLAGFNTYSGSTTVSAGTLSLSGAGDIPNSSVIDLAGGGLDVAARFDGTLPVYAAQTLKGNGTLAVTGNLVNNGTLELKVNRAGGIVTNDKLAVTGQISYGGTLKLVLSGQALTPADTITVVSAGIFGGGTFAFIDPAVPAPGLAWDTSTVASDGILRIAGTGVPTIGTATLSPSGNAIIFSGTGGVTNGPFTVLASTNVAAPLTAWLTNQTGSFDGNGNFSVTNAIIPGMPKQFFILQVP